MEPSSETLRTSWSLVVRLKNTGDQQSWAEFDELYRPLIFRVAVKAGLREDEAQDVVQETMAAMSRSIQDFVASSERGSFRAWLFQMARWRIKDQFQKRLPQAAAGSDAPAGGSARTATVERVPNALEPDLSALCDEAWTSRRRETALKELELEVKAEHYQIFHLAVLEERPIKEVGRIVGRSPAQIYLIKHRVGNVLKRIVKRLGKRLG